MSVPKTPIDEYIQGFPEATQTILQKLRSTIHTAAPEATEAMAYGIPTFKLNGNLVHFGGFKDHTSFFPGAEPIEVFADKLKKFKTSKGTIQFPLDVEIPYDLISEIVQFRVHQNTKQS